MRFFHRFTSLSVGFLWIAAGSAHGSVTTTYEVVIQDKVSGRQVVTNLGKGRSKVEFSYRDNGRGPDIFEDISVGGDGIISALTTTGKSTFGAPIDETFRREGPKASWKSKADKAVVDVSGPAVYVPIESSVEVTAVIARALLSAPKRTLAALPAGQLGIERMAEATLTGKTGRGKAALFAIRGIGLEPAYVWLWDDARAKRRLLGTVAPSFAILESGWEGNRDALLKAQIDADARSHKALAERLAIKRDQPVVIRDVRWFDSAAGAAKGPSDIHLYRGKIAAIYPANSPIRGAATVVDGSGKFLAPGLFDMHAHTGSWDAVLHMAGGVTTLRDMGNDNAFLNKLKSRIDRGEAIGPHIVPAGYIEGDSPFASYGGFVVKDVEAARRAIDWYAQHGYRQIKLYNSIRPEWVEPIAAHAKSRGLRVSGHVPAFMRAEEAVRAGFDEIQHINQVMLNFLVKKDDDTRTLLRFYLVGDNANQIDLDSREVNDFVRLLIEKKTAIDATLTAFEAMYLQRQGAPNPSYRMVAGNVPPAISRAWLTNSMDVNDKNAEAFRKSYDRLLGLVKKMHDAGVPLLAGSDDIAGFTLHRELELLVMAGLKPAEALQIATRNGARYSGVEDRTGNIEVGKDADLVLLDADPTVDISAVRRVSMTVKAGAMHFPAEIYKSLGATPFAPPPLLTEHNPPEDKR